MIFGTGLDIIEIERIKNSIKKYSPKFERKVFTSCEINYCQSQGDLVSCACYRVRFIPHAQAGLTLRAPNDGVSVVSILPEVAIC